MGVASGRGYQEVGVASGWNRCSRCCYKEVYRYPQIIINFPYSTCIRSFFGSSILTSLFIFKCFFGLVSVIFLQCIANVTHRTFEIVQKIEIPRI